MKNVPKLQDDLLFFLIFRRFVDFDNVEPSGWYFYPEKGRQVVGESDWTAWEPTRKNRERVMEMEIVCKGKQKKSGEVYIHKMVRLISGHGQSTTRMIASLIVYFLLKA